MCRPIRHPTKDGMAETSSELVARFARYGVDTRLVELAQSACCDEPSGRSAQRADGTFPADPAVV
jgi:hypothetical protein